MVLQRFNKFDVLEKENSYYFKSTQNPEDYRYFSLLRVKYNNLSKQCQSECIESTESILSNNPSKF